MPCRSDYDDAPPKNFAAEELAIVAPALCALFTTLEKNGFNPLNFINYDEAGIRPEPIKQWWEKHKKQDEARLAREAEEARRNAEANAAYEKLTPNERVALGLPRYKLKMKGQK